MFCPSCGTKNGNGARFCRGCGTALPQGAAQALGQMPRAEAPSQGVGTGRAPVGSPLGSAQPATSLAAKLAAGGRARALAMGKRACEWVRSLELGQRIQWWIRALIAGGYAREWKRVLAVVAVVLVIAVGVMQLMPQRAWRGTLTVDDGDTSIDAIKGRGSSFTVIDISSLDFISVDDSLYSLTGGVRRSAAERGVDVWELYGPLWAGRDIDASKDRDAYVSVFIPKGATLEMPFGRWGYVIQSQYHLSDGEACSVVSLILTLEKGSTGRIECVVGAKKGSDLSTLDWANVLSDSYNPHGTHDSGGYEAIRFTWTKIGPGRYRCHPTTTITEDFTIIFDM